MTMNVQILKHTVWPEHLEEIIFGEMTSINPVKLKLGA